jgi:hypothetical protein
MNYNNYFYNQTGKSLSSTLDILSSVNDTPSDGYSFTQLTYTHEFPGNWLQITGGQFQISNFDNNEYAGNQQTGFANYALTQNASQAYISTSVGAYVQLNPTQTISVVAGLQDANNTAGHTIQTTTIGKGPSTWFVYGQWTPEFPGLAAQYSLLYYNQPKIEAQPGISVSCGRPGLVLQRGPEPERVPGIVRQSQYRVGLPSDHRDIDRRRRDLQQPFRPWRARSDRPRRRLEQDQSGGLSGQAVRPSETVAETYWNVFVTPFLMVGPSVQVVFNPALHPESDTAGILTLRATGLFARSRSPA